MIKIELWSDFSCPFCYVGKTRFEIALNEFEHKDQIEMIYKAYQLSPNAPLTMKGSTVEAYAKGHGMSVEKAKERFKMIIENGKTVGLDFHYDNIQMTNTFDAHRVAKYANTKGKEPEVTTRFMKAYFTDGLNLADKDTLLKLATEVGLNKKEVKEVLDTDLFSDLVKEQIAESRTVGVQGVPFFVIDRKYAISGAQPLDYFKRSLDYIWAEHEKNAIETLETESKTNYCTDESCEI